MVVSKSLNVSASDVIVDSMCVVRCVERVLKTCSSVTNIFVAELDLSSDVVCVVVESRSAVEESISVVISVVRSCIVARSCVVACSCVVDSKELVVNSESTGPLVNFKIDVVTSESLLDTYKLDDVGGNEVDTSSGVFGRVVVTPSVIDVENIAASVVGKATVVDASDTFIYSSIDVGDVRDSVVVE